MKKKHHFEGLRWPLLKTWPPQTICTMLFYNWAQAFFGFLALCVFLHVFFVFFFFVGCWPLCVSLALLLLLPFTPLLFHFTILLLLYPSCMCFFLLLLCLFFMLLFLFPSFVFYSLCSLPFCILQVESWSFPWWQLIIFYVR